MSTKTPFAELVVDGERLAGRTEGLELNVGFGNPVVSGWIGLNDQDGAASDIVEKDAEIQLLGGRRGEGETALLTGIVAGDPERGGGAAANHVLHVRLADRWAVASRVSVVNTLMDVTPQDVLNHVLGLAGLSEARLTPRAFEPLHHFVLQGESLPGVAGLIRASWELEDWAVGFDGEGTFFWEPWVEHPGGTGTARELTGGELLELKTHRDGGGSFELFFAPDLFAGQRVLVLEEPEGRIEHLRHFFDGTRFRTQVVYGPIPG